MAIFYSFLFAAVVTTCIEVTKMNKRLIKIESLLTEMQQEKNK